MRLLYKLQLVQDFGSACRCSFRFLWAAAMGRRPPFFLPLSPSWSCPCVVVLFIIIFSRLPSFCIGSYVGLGLLGARNILAGLIIPLTLASLFDTYL